ncbi:type 3 dihydrofolate reductase [Agaribacter marinus]|uniref:Dihydrofolate reductase n=1 Tax=Agaribacter marinus TaxID=1431249 RepID=A0AA37T5I5_9ALTE|nr:type 3 dihydrofolate reductase [Agaribacter marinus]GLR72548.1 dihydrofolate reductase [Agaribacter marinus]
MKVSIIAAMAKNRIIGKDNQMPWHLPADLKHFKSVTLGKPVLMGRKTYESIGKALPGRTNIVISRNVEYKLDDARVVESVEEAMSLASTLSSEVMVIGGGAIYEALLPKATHLYLTFIDLSTDGDTVFPDYESVGSWQIVETEKHSADDKNPHDYTFVTLARSSLRDSPKL